MTSLLNNFKTAIQDLNEYKVKWALVGALAVSIHTEPRTTRDIDIAFAIKSKDDQENLIHYLLKRGYGNRQELMHVNPVWKLGVRLHISQETECSVPLDLLFSSSGIEDEVVQNAIKIEVFPAVIVPIASLPHTLAMKILSQNDGDRLRDKIDIQMLLAKATSKEIKSTEDALALIQERGFNRGKNLLIEFRESLKKHTPHFLKDL